MRKCAQCGGAIPPQQGRSAPRKFCGACRPSRNRRNPHVVELPAQPDELAEPALVRQYRRELEQAERLDTPAGAHVMHLVTLLATGQHTAAGAASLSKELRLAREEALKDAPRQADRFDELDARRRKKAELA